MASSRESGSKDSLFERDSRVVIRPWSGSGEPVCVVRARGSTVTDENGVTFLDFTSGYFVNQAGHCHPDVVAAATEQLGKVTQVSGRHTTAAAVELAEKLASRSPHPKHKVFFTTGGSESNEFAFKMVRQRTGKTDIAALDNAYHGLTLGVLAACASEKYRRTGGVPDSGYVYFLPNPYCYRCEHEKDCATQCLDGVEGQLDARPETAALIAEPIQAVGGIIPPEAWWQRLDEMRRKRGLLLILDEIQTGIGRTGKMFAAEHYGLEPDILTAGKGLSGGVGSLAAVLATPEIADGFAGGTTPTSAANAVSAASGSALIDVLERQKMIDNAAEMGDYFTRAVADLGDPWVGDIRFKGLLGGVELVADKASKEILPGNLVVGVKDRLHEDGMLLTVSGPHKNVLRLQPPLCITASELDTFVSSLKRALEATRAAAK